MEKLVGANIVGSKWVFCAKKDASGNVTQHPSRLIVAQDFCQVPGVIQHICSCEQVGINSERRPVPISVEQNLDLHQIDIKGASLDGKLTEKEQLYAVTSWL